MKMGLHPDIHTLHEARCEFQQVDLLRGLSVGMVHCTDGWRVGAQQFYVLLSTNALT